MDRENSNSSIAFIIGNSDVKIWQQTPADLWQKIFIKNMGFSRVMQVADLEGLQQSLSQLLSPPNKIFVAMGFYVVDGVTVQNLASKPNTILVNDQGKKNFVAGLFQDVSLEDIMSTVRSGVIAASPDSKFVLSEAQDLAGNYHHKLRKRYKPYVFDVRKTKPKIIEKTMFDGSYKGVTDIVTKYIWPPIALPLTRLAAFLRISPNMITATGFIFMLLATWLFYQGHFAWGLIPAWLMTLFDTVDGKLARVTLTSSTLGNVLDHGMDLIHPPFWWWAWWYGVLQVSPHEFAWFNPDYLLWVILGGYVAQRLIEGSFVRAHGMHIHVWQRLDSFFRLITARRNPNLVILTVAVIIGFPGWGLTVVGIWTAASFLFHLVRLFQAHITKKRQGNLVSWLST